MPACLSCCAAAPSTRSRLSHRIAETASRLHPCTSCAGCQRLPRPTTRLAMSPATDGHGAAPGTSGHDQDTNDLTAPPAQGCRRPGPREDRTPRAGGTGRDLPSASVSVDPVRHRILTARPSSCGQGMLRGARCALRLPTLTKNCSPVARAAPRRCHRVPIFSLCAVRWLLVLPTSCSTNDQGPGGRLRQPGP